MSYNEGYLDGDRDGTTNGYYLGLRAALQTIANLPFNHEHEEPYRAIEALLPEHHRYIECHQPVVTN